MGGAGASGCAAARPGRVLEGYVEEFLKAGTDRAREHCKKWLDVGVYHSGCPVQTKYY